MPTGSSQPEWLSRRGLLVLVALVVLVLFVIGAYLLLEQKRLARKFQSADEMMAAREYGKAKEIIESYLLERPGDTEARILAVRANRQARALAKAKEHLEKCVADGGDPDKIGLEAALLEVVRGDERPIPKLRERVKAGDPLSTVILEVLIQRDLDTYQLGSALDEFSRYLELKPDDLHALLGRGFVWERFLNFSEALGDYRRAVATHPTNERARLKLAETLLIVGPPEEALEHFGWLEKHFPGRPPVRLGLARCYRRLGEPEKAEPLLDKLVLEYPNHGETLWEKGEQLMEQGKADEAEKYLRLAAKALPYDRRVQFSLSRCLSRLKKEQEAAVFEAKARQIDQDIARMRVIRTEVMKDPNNLPLRLEGGQLFLRNGEKGEGIRWLQLVLRMDPDCKSARDALRSEGVYP